MANEVADPGTTKAAQLVPSVPITIETARQLGLNTVEELQAKLAQTTQTADNVEGFGKMVTDFTDAVAAFTKAMNNKRETEVSELQDDKFEELSRERMVGQFKALPDNDPRRVEIKNMLLQEYGANDLNLVLESGELKKALLRPISKSNPIYGEHNEFRKAWDFTFMLIAAWKGVEAVTGEEVRVNSQIAMKAIKKLEDAGVYGIERVKKALEKAMADANTGYGAEWLPTILSGDMVQDIWLSLQVAALFRRYQMPSKTFELPIRTSRARAYLVDEVVDDTAVGAAVPLFSNQIYPSSMGTSKVTFVARKLGSVIFVSDELEADAVIAVLEILREEVLYGMADAIEDATINGTYGLSVGVLDGLLDNKGVTANRLWADSGAGVRDARAAWNGLRHSINLSNVTEIDGAVSSSWATEGLDFFRNARKEMGKYGAVTTDDLVWLISPSTHIELLKLNQVLTYDKYGPNATIFSGEIGKLDGVPLIISPRIYTNLSAKGVYCNGVSSVIPAGNGSMSSATTGTAVYKTVAVLVNRRGYAFGDRQMVIAESERQPLAGQRYFLATARMDFKKLFANAEPLGNVIYDLATS